VIYLRLPGPDVKFYAILSIGSQYRLVALTPTLSCIFSASEGGDREALHQAFTAASMVQIRIRTDSFLMTPIEGVRLPYVSELRMWKSTGTSNSLAFCIEEKLHDDYDLRNQLLYLAQTNDGETILVKFVRRYCPDLHALCSDFGYAPTLLAYERLPGGWYGVAMEYLVNAPPLGQHERISEYYEQWKSELNKLVTEFHKHDYVHGDLRDANIISGDDGHARLIDFDWGGKVGTVSYPTLDLNEELLNGRVGEDPLITKADDVRILQNTLTRLQRSFGDPAG
jgi:hypothetical protein